MTLVVQTIYNFFYNKLSKQKSIEKSFFEELWEKEAAEKKRQFERQRRERIMMEELGVSDEEDLDEEEYLKIFGREKYYLMRNAKGEWYKMRPG